MSAARSFSVGGARLDARSAEEVVGTVASWARARGGAGGGEDPRPRTVCLVNAWSIASAARDAAFLEAINACDLSVVDGVPPSWVGRLLAGAPCERLSGPDLMHRLLSDPRFGDLTHFVYGGSPEALARLEFRYNLGGTRRPRRIVGTFSPSFGASPERAAAEQAAFEARLAAARPDILWVCLGTARQERWMEEARGRLAVPVLCGVGAAVDFLSGGKRRAPRLMQRAGLEWLFRLASEPRRLGRRYLLGNLLFSWHAAAALLGSRRGRRSGRAGPASPGPGPHSSAPSAPSAST